MPSRRRESLEGAVLGQERRPVTKVALIQGSGFKTHNQSLGAMDPVAGQQ